MDSLSSDKIAFTYVWSLENFIPIFNVRNVPMPLAIDTVYRAISLCEENISLISL